MAWGLFNKIKKGFKKVKDGVVKAAGWVNNNIIKPFKPMITTVANKFLPGSGAAVDLASNVIDAADNEDWDRVRTTVRDGVNFVQRR